MSSEKNTHSFGVEHYLYSVEFMEDFSSRYSLSDSSERLLQKIREERGYVGVFVERKNITKHVSEHQKITANKKQNISS